jgi:hypothetical protein
MNTKDDLERLTDRVRASVRKEEARATRELARPLIQTYSWLNSDSERRKFYQAHEQTLKHVEGLLAVCLQSAKPLTDRARREFEAIRGDGKMPRWAFESLSPAARIAFVQAGGRLTEK